LRFHRKLAVLGIGLAGLLSIAAALAVADSTSGTSGQPGTPPCQQVIAPAVPGSPAIMGCRVPVGQQPGAGLVRAGITGYPDPMNPHPGQTVKFMVSSEQSNYTAQIMRLYNADPNPAGPGIEAVPVTPVTSYTGHHQDLPLGSYVTVPNKAPLQLTGSFTVTAWIAPTTVPGGKRNPLAQYWTPTFTNKPQGIVSKWSGQSGYGLFVDGNGGLGLWLGNGSQRVDLHTGVAMHPWVPSLPGTQGFMNPPPSAASAQGIVPQMVNSRWYFVAASYDATTGRVTLVQDPQNYVPDPTRITTQAASGIHGIARTTSPLLIGAGSQDGPDTPPDGLYNGKIDNPRIYARALAPAEIAAIERGGGPTDAVANWDFSRNIRSGDVVDTSSNRLNGTTVNLPQRGVTGHNWDASSYDYTQTPDQYGAIYFHDDDLADARWPVSFTYHVPSNLESGVYAAKLISGSNTFWMPFYVTPNPGQPTASIALVIPTNTYIAYGATGVAQWYAEVSGLGLYSRHDDGSGVAYSTRLRPITSQQPAAYPQQFPNDNYLVAWLHDKGYKVDVLTDFDLQQGGAALLKRYRVVLTGAHPEYWTEQGLNALTDYVHSGGRLMYLGADAFYWVTGMDATGTYLEVRRRDGTEYWQAAPGESVLTTTGEEGGLWRFRGRPPQALVGVGMTAQGFTTDRPYDRMPDSMTPQGSWVFAGIPSHAEIGTADGLELPGGAAGGEIDRLDYTIGSPENTLLLARASNFDSAYQFVVEEVNVQDSLQSGGTNPLITADMTLLKYLGGGAVFSAGSLNWTASLFTQNDPTVSQVTQNVLQRFDSAAPPP
jgi:N,N-dimethylformamidase